MSVSRRFYISSTYEDLKDFRRRVAETITRLGHVAVGMEADGAGERPPLDVCLEDVRGCDAYIGIIGFRYGSCPPGEARSYTELEYEEAGQRPAPQRLVFLASPNVAPYPPVFVDKDDRITRFRHRLSVHSTAAFDSPGGLAVEVEKSILQLFGTGSAIPPLLPYLCDRREQEQALEASLQSRVERRPVVFVLHGDHQEAHRRFIDRLSCVTLPKLLSPNGADAVKVIEYRLRWPETRLDHAQLGGWLTRELARAVLNRWPGGAGVLSDVFVQMARMRGPVLVSTVTDPETWAGSEQETLVAFLRFWEQCPDFPVYHPLIVCLAISYSLGVRPAWWRLWRRWTEPGIAAIFDHVVLPSSSRLTSVRPPRLGHESVSRQHVQNWMDVEVKDSLDDVDEDALKQHVDRIFERRSGQEGLFIPMEPLAKSLKTALESSSTRRRGLFA